MTLEITALQTRLTALTSPMDDVFVVGVPSTESVNNAARQSAVESLGITPADCIGNAGLLTTRDLLSLAEHMLRVAQERQGSGDSEQLATVKPLWHAIDAAVKATLHAANVEIK